jgi:RimJ/RimL family protein N-acetyltransferase
MKVKTRCMTKKDLEDVNRIQNLRHPFGNDIYLIPRPYERTVKDYEKLAMDEHAFPLVVEVKGKVVGYSSIHVSSWRSRHIGFVGFSLDPKHVKPAAKPLVQATIDIGKRLNLVKLFTEILDESDELRKLVEDFGFKAETRRRKTAFFKRRFVDCIGMGLMLKEVPQIA